MQAFAYVSGNWAVEAMYFEVSRLVWTVFTLLMTLLRLQSSFFVMSWVLFPSLGRFLLNRMYDQGEGNTKKREKGKHFSMCTEHLLSDVTF